MNSRILLVVALICALVLSANYPDAFAQVTEVEVKFTKQVEVIWLHVYATNTTGDDKLLHVANINFRPYCPMEYTALKRL